MSSQKKAALPGEISAGIRLPFVSNRFEFGSKPKSVLEELN